MYSVVGSDGQVYGPVDMATLTQWIAEGRIVPTTNLIDPLDGRVIQAQQAPALYASFPHPSTATQPPVHSGPSGFPGVPGPTVSAGNYPRPVEPNQPGYGTPYYGPPKQKVVAILLAVFLGGFGIHRFYLGHSGTGVAILLLTLLVSWWTCGLITLVWVLIDIILIATDSLKEANGRALV